MRNGNSRSDKSALSSEIPAPPPPDLTLTLARGEPPVNCADRPRGSDSRTSDADICRRIKMTGSNVAAGVAHRVIRVLVFLFFISGGYLVGKVDGQFYRRQEDKSKCPKVKAVRNFDISGVSFEKIVFFFCILLAFFKFIFILSDYVVAIVTQNLSHWWRNEFTREFCLPLFNSCLCYNSFANYEDEVIV